MKITVLGMWHLGCVTAACCAKYCRVVGFDSNRDWIETLKSGVAPIREPGLNELIGEGLKSGMLTFSSDFSEDCTDNDVLWLCIDTPVDDDDVSDIDAVLSPLRAAAVHLKSGTMVIVSSQLPVGTCRLLELEFPNLEFVCLPENLRLGKALDVFLTPDRIVVGTRTEHIRPRLLELLRPFSSNLMFMTTESAEMVKHALNAFLAVSVTFANEIGLVCEQVGADAGEVVGALKADVRIGPSAYLNAGGPFAGGTLARDAVTLSRLGQVYSLPLHVVPAAKKSNDAHRLWAYRKLQSCLGAVSGKTVAILGLTYKPGTNTLRRSAAIELIDLLIRDGAVVHAHDPIIDSMDGLPVGTVLKNSCLAAVEQADALIVCTEWPDFRNQAWAELAGAMKGRVVIDANRFLREKLSGVADIQYFSVGRK